MPREPFLALVEELVAFNLCRRQRNISHAHPLSDPDELSRDAYFSLFSKMIALGHNSLTGMSNMAKMALPRAQEAADSIATARQGRKNIVKQVMSGGGW